MIDQLFIIEGGSLNALLGWHRIWDDEDDLQIEFLDYTAEEEAELVDLGILQICTMT